jgi:2-dehydro-3-deoxy-D-arabinonate dehydratase
VQLIRYQSLSGIARVALASDNKLIAHLPTPEVPCSELLRMHPNRLREYIEQAIRLTVYRQEKFNGVQQQRTLAPLDGDTEVWGADMTYKREGKTKREENASSDLYSRVYKAQRPELFFKANPRRVVGSEGAVVMRSDSTLNMPEAELVAVINCYGEIVGYTIGNDMSSHSLREENLLYLSQAKVYSGCCALGPGITPVWEVTNPYKLKITMTIERNNKKVWKGETSTRELRRRLDDLVAYLFREDDFPGGVFLCTGAALVPDSSFTLHVGDLVEITIEDLGTLRNSVVQGKSAFGAPPCTPQ